jgi:CRISPR-associated endonuclease/helicase Cas3
VSELFNQLRRIRYEWRLGEDVTLDSIADEIAAAGPQVLAVVSTTRDAARLHELLAEKCAERGVDDVPVLHLSTRMTAGHRMEVIDRIRADLFAGKPVRVVSTQLIEAGVDLDFPLVYRAFAPAESLQQAAGRCNRDGRLGEGVVVVFDPRDGGQPEDPHYANALAATKEFFGSREDGLADPDDLNALSAYYEKRYALHGGSDGRAMGQRIEELRREWDFPAVSEQFKMIDDRFNQPVVVVRKTLADEEQDRVHSDIELVREPYPCGPEPQRRLQAHTAILPRYVVKAALTNGLAKPVVGDLVEWLGDYHEDRGLDPANPEDAASFVV